MNDKEEENQRIKELELRKRTTKRFTLTCKKCGKLFLVIYCRKSRARFCSRKCFYSYSRKKVGFCDKCGKYSKKFIKNICMNCYNKNSYKKNGLNWKEAKKRYIEKDKERWKKYHKDWYFKNKEFQKEKNHIYYLNNRKIKLKYTKDYRIKNREKCNNYYINRRKKDLNFKIKQCLRNRLNTALKKYLKNNKLIFYKNHMIDYLAIIEHLKPFPENISKYHIDHIKPLCSFKFIKEDSSINTEEIKKAFAPENHQWLLAEQNFRKAGKYEN